MDIPVCDLPLPASFSSPTEDTHITRRNLPHWSKDGAIYWTTFRLADSLPQEKLNAWAAERDIWAAHHPKPWNDVEYKEYNERFGRRIEDWLDAGYGSCALARPEIRQMVRDCIFRFDGGRLRIHACVIMPNHVHLLLEPLPGNGLPKLLKGMKGASSHMAKRTLLTAGEGGKPRTETPDTPWKFWMDESYDHIVRCQEEYDHFRRYIADNPVKAGLSPGKYWLYEGESDTDIPVCDP